MCHVLLISISIRKVKLDPTLAVKKKHNYKWDGIEGEELYWVEKKMLNSRQYQWLFDINPFIFLTSIQ